MQSALALSEILGFLESDVVRLCRTQGAGDAQELFVEIPVRAS